MPFAARAQLLPMPLVGVLSPTLDPAGSVLPDNIAALVRGMRARGYVEGHNIKFEFRFAGWTLDRLLDLAVELAALNPDVIFTHTTNGVLAAKAATNDIPIVVGAAGDLVNRGLVRSLARPESNITGLTLLTNELDAKRIELLTETVPALQRIAILVNPKNPVWQEGPADLVPLIQHLRVSLFRADAESSAQIEAAFSTIGAERAGAVLVENDALFGDPPNRDLIASLAKRYQLPTIAESRLLADSGGLLGYGASIPAMFEYAASYIDKILKGAKPADLPVEQPTRFEFVINLKTAKALGVTVPPAVLVRADEVIE